MLELKAFVQESVHALDDAGLRGLCDTLRVDSRGCDDRRDIERILTGLLCLDKDTALGTFLTWLRTRETAQAHSGGPLARKSAFLNTFVPVISPRRAAAAEKPVSNNHEEHAVKDHHLNEEITTRLDELKLLEHDFKEAERQVHSGTPSFDKLKAFLVKLTKLRTKEEDVRRFFIKQSELLTQQHAQMKEETLHTRSQLDFFVDGFTNLRHRHDELVETSTRMKAENEVAQDVFLSITAQESHFGAVLHRTMLHMLDEKRELTQQLDDAREEIRKLKEKQQQLEQLVSRLKQERGNALKDASSYKLQLRKCKQKMDALATGGPDCAYFRDQAIQLRASLTSLLTLFRESIARDTKSAKQSLSKEVVRAVQGALLAPPAIPRTRSTSSRAESKPIIRVTGAASVEDRVIESYGVARVVEKKAIAEQDLDEVVRGVVLLGGQDGEAASCATALSTKLRYVPVDLSSLLEQLRGDVAQENQRIAQAAVAATVTDDTNPTPVSVPVAIPPPPPPTVENYLVPLKSAIKKLQEAKHANGVLLFNYELTSREANLLIGVGVPIDSVIDMKLPPPPPPPPQPTPLQPPPATPSKGKATTATKAPTSPTSRGAGPSGTRPTSKATPSSPSRPASRQATAETSKKSTPATSMPSTGRPATNAASPAKPKALVKTVDRKAVFASMPHAFAQLPPVQFVEDRVDQILEELARLKRSRETPFVAWDEATSQVNESLLMYAEDIHMMIWVEQDNRRPKKPGQDSSVPATPASSGGSKAGSNSPSRTGGASSTSKTPAKAPAKGKAASPTRSPAKPGSPTKPAAKAKATSPAKPAAASPPNKRTSTATTPAPKVSPTKPGASSPPGKRKA